MTAPAPSLRPAAGRPRVVIIGGGFAGVSAARVLRREPVDVVLIDRTNHHLFQPLLYQVATAMLSPSDISVPIRWLMRDAPNVTVLLGEVTRVDPVARVVRLGGPAQEIAYDRLIIAAGMRNNYFGHDRWEDHAPGLKTVDDALRIRRRFLLAFERAERTTDVAEQRAWLTFVIIGAGPTGVELAGMLPEVARAFRREFRRIDPLSLRVVLIEGSDRVLPAFDPELSTRARRDLEQLGVEVRTGTMVTDIDDDGIRLAGGEHITAREIFWAAGIKASPLTRDLGVPLDRAGRVRVAEDLSVPGHPDVFVVGDLAIVDLPDGRQMPGVAPAANQTGRHAARCIVQDLRGAPRRSFRFFDKGDLATIGRHKAVARFGRVKMGGYFAWLMWLVVHVLYLASFRNRLSVMMQWAYSYLTFQRGVRLITGSDTGEFPVPDGARL
jgi:NADH dehydrogenase